MQSLTIGTKFTVKTAGHPKFGVVSIITNVGAHKYSYKDVDGGTAYKANVNRMTVVTMSKKDAHEYLESGHWAIVNE